MLLDENRELLDGENFVQIRTGLVARILTNAPSKIAIALGFPTGTEGLVAPCGCRSIPRHCCAGRPRDVSIQCDDTAGAKPDPHATARVQYGGATDEQLRDLSAARHHVLSRPCRLHCPCSAASSNN